MKGDASVSDHKVMDYGIPKRSTKPRDEASPHCESQNSKMGVFAVHPAGRVCYLSHLSTQGQRG